METSAKRAGSLRSLDEFRTMLEGLDDDEIRDRLNTRRIRNPERRTLAEKILQDRAQAQTQAPEQSSVPDTEAGDERSEADLAAERPGAVPAPSTPEPEPAAGAAAAVSAARRVGRIVGVGLGLAVMAVAVVALIRR